MILKIVNLNIWNGGVLLDGILEFIKNENADILLLQEVYNGRDEKLEKRFLSLDVLKKLPYAYHSFAPAFIDLLPEGKIESGNLILSKFPIINSGTYFFDVPFGERDVVSKNDYEHTPRNIQSAEIDINGFILNAFNTQGVWGVGGEDNERRLKMSSDIIEKVKDKANVILGGDFNVKEYTESIRNIEKTSI